MIAGFAFAIVGVAAIAALVGIVLFARKSSPNDISLGATLLVALLLLVQVVWSIVAPLAGNPAVGDPLEFWLYLIVAFALPIGAVVWALIDRTPWANLVLAVVNVAVAVMTLRMLSIWAG
ncbi:MULTISPECIES: hypothetical protein [unclassified Leucobacter]|uniref:hypothetical protein n=1 Tax=unclassified Leucobacter TaxID=2621730 RepID=UPI00165DE01C|nr:MULTISPECIES: hypothetical protein [unclassified Leucobacter]MBC9936798.1 hypothetical protein [Leucobacter sp. cx-87]